MPLGGSEDTVDARDPARPSTTTPSGTAKPPASPEDWLNRSLTKEAHDSVSKSRDARNVPGVAQTPSSLDAHRAEFQSGKRYGRFGGVAFGNADTEDDDGDTNTARDLFANLSAPPPSFASRRANKNVGGARFGAHRQGVAGLGGHLSPAFGGDAVSLQDLLARKAPVSNTGGGVFSPSKETDAPRRGNERDDDREKNPSNSDSFETNEGGGSPVAAPVVAAALSPKRVGFGASGQKSKTGKFPEQIGDSDSDDDGNKIGAVRAGTAKPKPKGRPKGSFQTEKNGPGRISGEAAKLLAHAFRLQRSLGSAGGGGRRRTTGGASFGRDDDSGDDDAQETTTPAAALSTGRGGRQRRPPSAYWMGSGAGSADVQLSGSKSVPLKAKTVPRRSSAATVKNLSGGTRVTPEFSTKKTIRKRARDETSDDASDDSDSETDSESDSEDVQVGSDRGIEMDADDAPSASDSDSDLPLAKRKRDAKTVVASSDSDDSHPESDDGSDSNDDPGVAKRGGDSDGALVSEDEDDASPSESPLKTSRKSPKAKASGREPSSAGKAGKALSAQKKQVPSRSVLPKNPTRPPSAKRKADGDYQVAEGTKKRAPISKEKNKRGRQPGSAGDGENGKPKPKPVLAKDSNGNNLPKGKRGGFRANAGRPKGAFGKKNRDLVAEGKAPTPTGPSSGKQPKKPKRPKTKAETERALSGAGDGKVTPQHSAAAKKALAKKGRFAKKAPSAATAGDAGEVREHSYGTAAMASSPPPRIRPWARAIGGTLGALNLTPSPSPRRVSPRRPHAGSGCFDDAGFVTGNGSDAKLATTNDSASKKKADAVTRQRERERRWETSRTQHHGASDDFDDDFAVFDFADSPVKNAEAAGLDKVVGMAIGSE